ncbi:MAG: glycosyl hydrolase family 18 protein [Eubacterium sp.]
MVKEGETVDSIAYTYGVSVDSVTYTNQIPYPYKLAIGETLLILAGNDIPYQSRNIYSGGYAYPFISRWVLEQTLPYLSYLYIFSYGFTTDGDLIPPLVDDTWMIELAHQYGVAPILTLTPLGPDGRFSNELITAVVNNLQARENLKNAIVSQIVTRGFEGLDIDFEYVLASDREAFVDFTLYMKEAVSALGYLTSVALAPKTSDTQTGLLYEGKDYKRLGEVADYVLLMTYEWGYTYGPPMAVAPLNKVRQVVEYALTVIPSYKIHLGIPNYGYDWPLPYVRGTTQATTIGNVEAVQIAIANNAAISFDDIAASPYFNYSNYDIAHEVWFEDVRSINYKFNLLEQYNLRGATYWQLMRLFRANWVLMNNRFIIT